MKRSAIIRCALLVTIQVCFVRSCRNGAVADIVFAVDSSRSTGSSNYASFYVLLANVVKLLDMGESATRVGLVSHDTNPVTNFPLTGNVQLLTEKIKSIRYQYNAIQTVMSLSTAARLFSYPHVRTPEVTNVLFYVTDGTDAAKPMAGIKRAQLLKEEGYKIVTLGILKEGKGANEVEMKQMASTPEDSLVVPDYEALNKVAETIATMICEAAVGNN